VGYVTYDMVRRFEKLSGQPKDVLGLPDSFFMLTQDLFIFDHVSHSLRVVRTVPVKKGSSLEALYHRTVGDLTRLVGALRPTVFPLKLSAALDRRLPPATPQDRRDFIQAVKKAKGYIAAGDVIQVVHSRRMSFRTKAHPLDIYRSLRRINPSPYMYFLRDGDTHIVGSSPEVLVRLEDGVAETRPIAGTRPRGVDQKQDDRLAENLRQDTKERAEHLMLVDLARNDLGRVCRPGTVKVSNFMNVEKYSHVMHLVSTCQGTLAPPRDAFDLFRACFPAGTLSGAPKIRAMEIIDELETSRRGLYGGAVGYFSYTGNMDMAIAIRTLLLKKGVAHIQAGAGIVADSLPGKEFQETQNKAAAVVAALRAAETTREWRGPV
jgi:anthranilate synthase component 1